MNRIRKSLIAFASACLVSAPFAFASPAQAEQLIIIPFVSCGGATTCDGASAYSLLSGTGDLNTLGLPSFGSVPIAFGITNNSGSTLTSLTLTLTGSIPVIREGWNDGTSGWNALTNPFSVATIDGFNGLSGSSCTGGAVNIGADLSGGTCNSGALPATFVWTLGTGVGIAPGESFVLSYNSPHDGNVFTVLPPVPEPATWALMLLGFGMIGVAMRRRKVLATA